MKVTKEKARDNRERILVAAARLFRERGLSGVGVDTLTEAAGLTYGSVYSQFGSKDRLMAEALSEGFARTEPIAARIDSLEQFLRNICRSSIGIALERDATWQRWARRCRGRRQMCELLSRTS